MAWRHHLGLTLAALGFATSAWAADGRLTLGMVLEPPHLDPTAGAAAAIDEVVYANLFEGLTRIDAEGAVQPALAADWTISADGLTYSFDLRQGVTFHDGTALDAEDVVFTFERAMAEDSVNAQKPLFAAIEQVTALDDDTVELTLSRPSGDLLYNLGWGDAVIVAPESAASNKNEPVGTGPFRFARWVQGDRVELERFADYWGDAPALEAVTFSFIPDPAAALTAMLAGDLDAFANFPAPENMAQFEADPRLEVVIGTTEGETILAINNDRKPFNDARVRRAIAYAIDRQAVIDGAMFGYATPIGSHFAPHHPAYVDLAERRRHDTRMARALLREAGADGLEVTLKLPPPAYARRSGEIVAQQLQEIGLSVSIEPIEWAQWLEQVFRNKDYDLTIVAHTEPLDIGIYAREDYYFGFEDEEFAEIIDELARTAEPAARRKLYGRAQRVLAEAQPNAFLFQLPKLGVWKREVEGLWHNSPVQANDVSGARIEG